MSNNTRPEWVLDLLPEFDHDKYEYKDGVEALVSCWKNCEMWQTHNHAWLTTDHPSPNPYGIYRRLRQQCYLSIEPEHVRAGDEWLNDGEHGRRWERIKYDGEQSPFYAYRRRIEG